jgi:hypothetical protein
VFSQQRIEEAFHKFVTVRLYTDRDPTGGTQVPDPWTSAEFRNKLGNEALPYYVVLVPRGKALDKIAVTGGLIDSADEFIDFLNKALERSRQTAAEKSNQG